MVVPVSVTPDGDYTGFDFVTWYVGNALQASSFFVTRFGFEAIAYRGPETGSHLISSYVVSSGSVSMLFMAPIRGPDDNDSRATEAEYKLFQEIHAHLARHGDGIKDIGFRVSNVRKIWQRAVYNGARSISTPQVLEEEGLGKVVCATIVTYGDTTHTLIDRTQYRGAFMPGFQEAARSDPINNLLPKVELIEIDHCVGNQPWHSLDEVINYYENALSFHRYWMVDDKDNCSDYSAMRSIVVASPNEVIKMPMNEPAIGLKRSQIEEFVDYYNGAGCQHIAFRTSDIISAVDHLGQRGVCFLQVPGSYYASLGQRLAGNHVELIEKIDILEKLNILVDFDERGYLLQVFAKHVLDRPTVFVEIIQRENFDGFGAGNFKSLFKAFEQEQALRGNL